MLGSKHRYHKQSTLVDICASKLRPPSPVLMRFIAQQYETRKEGVIMFSQTNLYSDFCSKPIKNYKIAKGRGNGIGVLKVRQYCYCSRGFFLGENCFCFYLKKFFL